MDIDHHPTLTDQDRLIVGHLANGHTHAATAKALHLSERTIRRRLHELCHRYGVATVLALGVLLGQAGEITTDTLQRLAEL